VKPHVSVAYGSPEAIARVIWDHLEEHHRVDPRVERPFVISSTPCLEGEMHRVQMVQLCILVNVQEED
jgi:hypothetical protein